MAGQERTSYCRVSLYQCKNVVTSYILSKVWKIVVTNMKLRRMQSLLYSWHLSPLRQPSTTVYHLSNRWLPPPLNFLPPNTIWNYLNNTSVFIPLKTCQLNLFDCSKYWIHIECLRYYNARFPSKLRSWFWI